MSYYTPYAHDERWYRRKIGWTVRVDVLTASTTSNSLRPGLYRLLATVDCWVKQGASDVFAEKPTAFNSTTAMLLKANTEWFVNVDVVDLVDQNDSYIAVIRDAADGVLYLTKISDLRDP